jgi:hypothetical protein
MLDLLTDDDDRTSKTLRGSAGTQRQKAVSTIEDYALAGNEEHTTHARDRAGINGAVRSPLNSD